MLVFKAKPLGRALLGSIALCGVVECLKNGDEGWGAYSSAMQDPQSLTRALQAEVCGRTLAQFCNHLLDGRVRSLAATNHAALAI